MIVKNLRYYTTYSIPIISIFGSYFIYKYWNKPKNDSSRLKSYSAIYEAYPTFNNCPEKGEWIMISNEGRNDLVIKSIEYIYQDRKSKCIKTLLGEVIDSGIVKKLESKLELKFVRRQSQKIPLLFSVEKLNVYEKTILKNAINQIKISVIYEGFLKGNMIKNTYKIDETY